MLTWTDLAVGYGRRIVLDLGDGSLGRGIGAVLRGPNGGGKSTLLQTWAGALAPRRGRVQAAGRVAWIPQVGGLRPDLPTTLAELVGLAGPPGPALAAVGLGHLGHQRWSVSSGGERQRALIARAWAARPQVILADEPDSHLDHEGRHLLACLLEDHRHAGGTWVAVLHGTLSSTIDRTATCNGAGEVAWT